MNKNPISERATIRNQPEKRPYGVKIELHVMTYGDLGNLHNTCFLLDTGSYFTLKAVDKAPWEAGQKLHVELEGFATASSAEHSGKKLIQAILWCAIKYRRTIKLNYQTYEPAYVYERNRSKGSSISSDVDLSLPPILVINEICDGYSKLPDPDPNLLLSMEVFAASKLETSERAKYLSMVSAFELLADCKSLGEEVEEFLKSTEKSLKSNPDIPEHLKTSLSGRLLQLKKESIRQALKRFVKEMFPEHSDIIKIIEEAYSIRSQITHEGRPNNLDIDLNSKMDEFEKIIISIYQEILNKKQNNC